MFAPFTLIAILLIGTVTAEIKPYIITHTDIYTECKTCPHVLCPNVQNDDVDVGAFSVTCWAHGTKIMGNDLWLKTELGCYVTQYDVTEYDGDYTTDLAWCGPSSEIEDLTIKDATTKYKTECLICPWRACDIVSYLRENVDLELTCWVPDGEININDTVWLKTTQNCYVPRINLKSQPDITYLDPCGPIPPLEIENHNNENGTSEVDKRAEAAPVLPRAAHYLINVTIGEEYSYCRSCPRKDCRVQKVYEFNQEVWLQCYTRSYYPNNTQVDNGWVQTRDFCYTPIDDYWESVTGDHWRFPLCEYFTDTGSAPGDDDEK